MLVKHSLNIRYAKIVVCKALIYCRLCLFSGRHLVGNDIERDLTSLDYSSGKYIHSSIGTQSKLRTKSIKCLLSSESIRTVIATCAML